MENFGIYLKKKQQINNNILFHNIFWKIIKFKISLPCILIKFLNFWKSGLFLIKFGKLV